VITACALAALLLSQAAPPPLDDAQRAQPLPPNHPALPQGQGQPLPPGHPQLGTAMPSSPNGQAPTAADLIKQLDSVKGLKDQDKPFDVASAVGKLYFGNGRFDEATLFFKQAMAKVSPLRALFLAQKAKADAKHEKLPEADSVGCHLSSEAELPALTQKAQALAAKGQSAAAAACAKAGLKPALDVESLLADALFLSGDSKGALAEHAAVLQVDPKEPNSLYGHAGVLFDGANDDVAQLKKAKAELAHFIELYPSVPHAAQAKLLVARAEQAIAAGGMSKLPHPRMTGPIPHRQAQMLQGPMMAQGQAQGPMMAGAGGGNPPALTQDQINAVQNTERTPEMMQGLQKLVEQGEDALAQGKFQDALDAYKRVVPFEPENGRAKAGMAWALVGMNRQPMADRIWQVAVGADPAAVDHLGDTLKAKGNAEGAKALWSKLAGTAPDYALKANLQGKL
jgi:tetratricopeptide (TPR) repeat protein